MTRIESRWCMPLCQCVMDIGVALYRLNCHNSRLQKHRKSAKMTGHHKFGLGLGLGLDLGLGLGLGLGLDLGHGLYSSVSKLALVPAKRLPCLVCKVQVGLFPTFSHGPTLIFTSQNSHCSTALIQQLH